MYIESLINKSKLGDNAAFTELVNLIYKRMYVIAKSRLDIEEDANDAVQEAIISIHKNLKKLKDEKKFNSWSTIILINKCKEIEGKYNKY